MPNRLLDRQVRLLEHLTSGAGIFGADRDGLAVGTLWGIPEGLLHLEARFSHEKRMQKIEWVLTRTLDLLGGDRTATIRDFIETCPPMSISWLENARQFHGFLKIRWLREKPAPPHLPDIASYELAYAAVRAGEVRKSALSQNASEAPAGAVRLHPTTVLLRCAYDIRPVLEGNARASTVARRETRLAVAMSPGMDEPLVSELSSDIFALLEMLDQFADPALFEDAPDAHRLITGLAARGLLEVCR